MRTEKSSLLGFVSRWSGIAFAAAVLAVTPQPVAADVASASGTGEFSEAGSALLQFSVNPDGSISGYPGCIEFISCDGVTSAPLNWELNVNGVPLGPHGEVPGLDFPSLPPGSTINSATFSFTVFPSPADAGPGNNVFWTVQGSLAVQSVTLNAGCAGQYTFTPLGTWSAPFPAGNTVSFVPCTTGELFYYPDFSGGGDATAVANIPSEPGAYFAGVNVLASADFTVTVDYSVAPEPGTYGFLVGLGMVGFFAIRMGRARSEL
jgi:hypothetical protein